MVRRQRSGSVGERFRAGDEPRWRRCSTSTRAPCWRSPAGCWRTGGWRRRPCSRRSSRPGGPRRRSTRNARWAPGCGRSCGARPSTSGAASTVTRRAASTRSPRSTCPRAQPPPIADAADVGGPPGHRRAAAGRPEVVRLAHLEQLTQPEIAARLACRWGPSSPVPTPYRLLAATPSSAVALTDLVRHAVRTDPAPRRPGGDGPARDPAVGPTCPPACGSGRWRRCGQRSGAPRGGRSRPAGPFGGVTRCWPPRPPSSWSGWWPAAATCSDPGTARRRRAVRHRRCAGGPRPPPSCATSRRRVGAARRRRPAPGPAGTFYEVRCGPRQGLRRELPPAGSRDSVAVVGRGAGGLRRATVTASRWPAGRTPLALWSSGGPQPLRSTCWQRRGALTGLQRAAASPGRSAT